MPVVDFMVVGFMKSGTTTLNDYLSLNENILMCPSKEPQFFSSKYDEGIANYESLWSDTTKVCGEASTCYSRWPFYQEVPKRVASYNAGMKLIFIMRDPIERAYSHFRHNVLTDQIKYKSFSDALSKSEEIRLTSMYMTQIEKFLEFFPKEQMLLIDFDELTKNPIITINEIEIFLGVNTSSPSKIGMISSNKVGFAAGRRDVINFLDRIRKLPILNNLINLLLSSERRKVIRSKILSVLNNSKLLKKHGKVKAEKLAPPTDSEKLEFWKSIALDIDRLENFWGKDLSKWKLR